jgi:23S rRNA (adenine2503-C2)-methyltransferase
VETLSVLSREETLGSFDTPERAVSQGLVQKLLLGLSDGNAIEAILIATFGPRVAAALRIDLRVERRLGVSLLGRVPRLQQKIRYETCISTQVGCALGCVFCASSLVPFLRNLGVDEMLREIATVEAEIPRGGALKKVLFGGIGEPLMNYDNVVEVARRMAARGIGARVHTVGVTPYLERFFADYRPGLPWELAVSLHAPENELRTELMPVSKGYPIDEVCRTLAKAPPGLFIEAKYLMLAGVNDSLDQARQLADLLAGLPVHITLQLYNRIAERELHPSDPARVLEFQEELRKKGARVGILNSNIGGPVQGGCGQLRAKIAETSKRLRVVN